MAALLCIGIVVHEAHCHVNTWLSETYVSTTACLSTVSLLKMASVLQHGVKFCSELGKSGFGNTCSVANRFGNEASMPQCYNLITVRYQLKMQAELANKECYRDMHKVR